MKNILITGSNGFIGTHLVAKLEEKKKFNVQKIDRSFGDIANEKIWNDFPKCETVIHLACRTFIPDSWINPWNFIKTNVMGIILALNYCKKNNSRLILLSSYVYGKPKKIPIKENEMTKATNPYTLSKQISENLCKFYSSKYGVNVIILRPFNVYGLKQKKHFLIPLIVNQIKFQKIIKVKNLKPKRDFIYIKDLTNAIIKTIDLRKKFEIINIGSGASYSVEKIIAIIQKIKGTNLLVKSSKEIRSDEIMDTRADITKAKKILNWYPKWSFERGIRDSYGS